MIDASIALGVRPPQIDSPMNALAKVLQVREAQQGQQMNALKMDEYQRGITDQNSLRQLISGFGTDRGANYQTLLKAGRLKEATDYSTTQDAAEKSQTESITSNLKLFQSFAPQVKSPEDAAAYTRAMYNHPVLGKFAQQMGSLEDAMKRNAEAFAQNPQGWLQASAGVSADKLMEMMRKTRTNTNLGNVNRGESVDYFGNVDPKLTTNTPIARSPDSLAVDARITAKSQAGPTTAAPSAARPPQKPLPVGALRMRIDARDAANTADGINERLSNVEKRIADGKLNFGPVSNLISSGLNAAGMSTENSRNLSSFKSEMEKLRNDSLRLNKGVQTDGDAQRAWNELFQNINDTELVKQRLAEIKILNERAKSLKMREVEEIDENYGRDAAPSGGNILDEADKILNGG